jgi:hypothetical protein
MITRSQMRRQLRAKGGIMNVAPRKKFLFGGLGDRLRKLIPNELANVAVKAAPFVAMIPGYGPAAAAAMRGIGRYDQRGDFKDALKQGLGTYAGGKLFGTGMEKFRLRDPGASGIGDFFNQETRNKASSFFKGGEKSRNLIDTPPGGGDPSMTFTKPTKGLEFVKEGTKFIKDLPIIRDLPPLVQQQILVGGVTSAGTYIYQKFLGEEPPQEEGETMEEYLARRKVNVGKKMRSYFDNYFKFDKEYSSLDDAGKDAFVARYNMMSGGRAGYQTGGITMANTLAENMRRNLANQQAVSQQFQAARSRLPGYVAPQRIAAPTPTPVQEGSLGPIGKFPTPPGGDVQPILPVMPDQPGLFPQPPKKIIQPKERVVKKPIDIVDFYEEVTQPPPVSVPDMPIDAPTKIIQPMPPMETDFSKEINWQPGQPAPEGFKVEKMLGDEFLVPDDSQYMPPTEEESLIGGPVPPVKTDEEILAERELNPPTQPFFPTYNNPLPKDQLLSGFEQFKRDNPEVMQGAGTAAIVPVTLPGGYSYDFSGSLEANAFRKYLESIGQAPYQGRRQPGDLKSIEGGLSKLAGGGMPMGEPRVNQGGITELDYRAKGGFVPVGIKEKADDVPAMLSKNEFVFTADAVRGAGNGSVEKGAQKMYDTMKNLERRVT